MGSITFYMEVSEGGNPLDAVSRLATDEIKRWNQERDWALRLGKDGSGSVKRREDIARAEGAIQALEHLLGTTIKVEGGEERLVLSEDDK